MASDDTDPIRDLEENAEDTTTYRGNVRIEGGIDLSDVQDITERNYRYSRFGGDESLAKEYDQMTPQQQAIIDALAEFENIEGRYFLKDVAERVADYTGIGSEPHTVTVGDLRDRYDDMVAKRAEVFAERGRIDRDYSRQTYRCPNCGDTYEDCYSFRSHTNQCGKRKKDDSERRKDHRVKAYFTEDEKELLADRASHTGLSQSEYLRRAFLLAEADDVEAFDP